MPAQNSEFPWMSYYGHYRFFEEKMKSHDRICDVQKIREGIYKLKLSEERVIRVFICECYAFGLAEYYETVDKIGEIQAVIINSNWCGYTIEAKRHCRKHSIGLFSIGEFMAALNIENYWEYLTKEDRKYFKKQGWL